MSSNVNFAIFSHIWSMWISHVGLSFLSKPRRSQSILFRNPSFFAISKRRQLRQARQRPYAGRVGATDVLHRGLRVLRRAVLCGELHRQRRRCRSEEPLGRAGRQRPGVVFWDGNGGWCKNHRWCCQIVWVLMVVKNGIWMIFGWKRMMFLMTNEW